MLQLPSMQVAVHKRRTVRFLVISRPTKGSAYLKCIRFSPDESRGRSVCDFRPGMWALKGTRGFAVEMDWIYFLSDASFLLFFVSTGA